MANWILRLAKKRSRQGLYEFLEAEFDKIASNSKVLSVGSGGEVNNRLKKYAGIHSFEVRSFDIDPKRGPDIVGDICEYDFGQTTFDVVVICEVLEHLHSPHLGIANIFRSLRPGGRIILSTPFILPIHEAPYDYFRFTRYGLLFLLKSFENVIVKERNSYFEAIDVLWIRTYHMPGRKSRLLSYFVIPFFYFFVRPVTLLLTWIIKPQGMTTGYVVSADKPK